jgi:vacuolar-type H+-ATPase subunit E/Vma4
MSGKEEALTREITVDARRRAERAMQRAEREAGKIIADAEKRAHIERDAALQDARQEAKRRERVAAARIAQDLAALRRESRSDAVESARRLAGEKLAALAASDKYRDVLVGLSLRAIEAMPDPEFRLALRPKDRALFGADLPQQVAAAARSQLGRDVRVELAEETLSACGGLMISSGNGRCVADQTFEARLERMWDELRSTVASQIAASESGTCQ